LKEDGFVYNYILLGLLLLISFYFSGSETAIFSLNRLERNALKETKSKRKNKIITFLLENQDQLLITILTGNMIVNIFASSMGSIIGDHLFKGKSEVLSILTMTILLLMVGELTPKRIAVNHSKSFTRITATPLYYLHLVFSPVRFILNHISAYVLKFFPSEMGVEKEDKHALVLSTAELGYNQAILLHSEYSLFKSYLSFKGKNANGIMTPRSELKTLSCKLSLSEVFKIIASNREYVMNSTVLLHDEDSDHLFGWVPVNSILESKYNNVNPDQGIKSFSKKFLIVPESKVLPTLISEMREQNIDLVLLLDEYGGTAGVLWFRNVIEDVLRVFYNPVKEKFDEKKQKQKVIAGSMAIEDFEDFLGMEIHQHAETVAGFFLEIFGGIPVPGDEIQYHEISMRVLDMDGNRINNLVIETRPDI
jgi:putative hemolysin